jgi:hypothetical protein
LPVAQLSPESPNVGDEWFNHREGILPIDATWENDATKWNRV